MHRTAVAVTLNSDRLKTGRERGGSWSTGAGGGRGRAQQQLLTLCVCVHTRAHTHTHTGHSRTHILQAVCYTLEPHGQKLLYQQWVLIGDHRYPPHEPVVFPSLTPTTSSPCFHTRPSTYPPTHPHFSFLSVSQSSLLLLITPTPSPAHTLGLTQGESGLWWSFPDVSVSFLLWECGNN